MPGHHYRSHHPGRAVCPIGPGTSATAAAPAAAHGKGDVVTRKARRWSPAFPSFTRNLSVAFSRAPARPLPALMRRPKPALSGSRSSKLVCGWPTVIRVDRLSVSLSRSDRSLGGSLGESSSPPKGFTRGLAGRISRARISDSGIWLQDDSDRQVSRGGKRGVLFRRIDKLWQVCKWNSRVYEIFRICRSIVTREPTVNEIMTPRKDPHPSGRYRRGAITSESRNVLSTISLCSLPSG